jgi:hypothetical protein
VVKRWISELDIASSTEEDFRKKGREAWGVYKSEKQTASAFNIMWSNTETLRPALYNSKPSPDVRRRFRDADPLGKYGALVLKRALTYSIDEYDFDKTIQDAVLDILVPGRGVARVKYEPKFRAIEGAELDPLSDEPPPEELAYEQTICAHVPWDCFRRGPGEKWEEVQWVAFKHRMAKDQLVEMFGEETAEEVPLSESESEDKSKDKTIKSLLKTAEVWEVWDKASKKVLFICPMYDVKPLLEQEDPLRLSGFFPMPRPVYMIEDSTSLIPQPHYEKYRNQAEELNKISKRIDKIVAALKVRGAYASNLSEMATIIEAADNQMVPIVNASEVAAFGGLDKAVWIMPIEKLAGVLQELYKARAATLQTIYEITGLGDIMRGVSNPHETLGAQQLKSQWGTLRLQRLQREVQRFICDLMQLKGEVIAEHFQMETLQAMTGVELPTAEDKVALQMKMQQAQMTGQPPPEDMALAAQHVLKMPTWEDVMGLLRSDQMRRFKIGIETDSTIQETLTRDAQGMQEAVTAVVNLFNGLAPAMESGALSVEVAKTIALSMARNAKMGDAVEEAIEQIKQPPPPPPPPPDKSVEVAQVKVQGEKEIATMREQSSTQLEAQKMQHAQQVSAIELQNEQRKAMQEAQLAQQEAAHKAQIAQIQEQGKLEIERARLETQILLKRMEFEFEAQQKDLDRQSAERIADKTAEANAREAAANRDATMAQAHLSAETTKEVAKTKAVKTPNKE